MRQRSRGAYSIPGQWGSSVEEVPKVCTEAGVLSKGWPDWRFSDSWADSRDSRKISGDLSSNWHLGTLYSKAVRGLYQHRPRRGEVRYSTSRTPTGCSGPGYSARPAPTWRQWRRLGIRWTNAAVRSSRRWIPRSGRWNRGAEGEPCSGSEICASATKATTRTGGTYSSRPAKSASQVKQSEDSR